MKSKQVVVRRQVLPARRSYISSAPLSTDDYDQNIANSTTIVRYGECHKNHAARIGGYAVDGCREFMASGEEGTSNAFICAACGCHRNFHRKEYFVDEAEVVCDCSSPSS